MVSRTKDVLFYDIRLFVKSTSAIVLVLASQDAKVEPIFSFQSKFRLTGQKLCSFAIVVKVRIDSVFLNERVSSESPMAHSHSIENSSS